MMYFLLILFFASLIGIVMMIGRKLSLVKNGHITEGYHPHPFMPDLHRIKYLSVKSLKSFVYLVLFVAIRSYFRLSNFLKNKYDETKIKIKEKYNKSHFIGHLPERQEVNKFLKVIGDYKNKISEIKHKVKEEENNS